MKKTILLFFIYLMFLCTCINNHLYAQDYNKTSSFLKMNGNWKLPRGMGYSFNDRASNPLTSATQQRGEEGYATVSNPKTGEEGLFGIKTML